MRARVPVIGVAVAALVAVWTGPAVDAVEGETTIRVDAVTTRGPAMTNLLGVNHRYNADGYDLWNVAKDAPHRAVVDGGLRVGIQSLRFPGGTIANTYDWKHAIGDERGCQVDGRGSGIAGFGAVTGSMAFGPDEFMEYVGRIGAEPLIMVPFVTETPEDAADWVEYMNSPAGDLDNPNGGVDWAELRAANGHPEPYGVLRWEIGNEQHHLDSRHWLSPDTSTAASEYAFGGSRSFIAEALGKNCDHPLKGVPSDGTHHQVFEVLYPPVDPSLFRVDIDGRRWRQVPDLGAKGPRARVFELRPESGEVVFGDGEHGAVPPQDSPVLGSYESVHEGYFAFAEAMKAVDPSIDVCASFGRVAFLDAAAGLDFDCLTTHPITSLAGPGEDHATWADALEGHDRMMLAADQRRRGISKLERALPDGTPLWFTEAAAVQGDHAAFPTWASSATQAAYMATGWGDWMELGIQFAMSSVFLGGDRSLLGSRRSLTISAEGVTRETIAPMFNAGGELLPAGVEGNPVRQPEGMDRSYAGLAVTAIRDPEGAVQLLVVNRLPTDAVTARVLVDGQTSVSAELRTVVSDGFQASNRPGTPPEVTMEVTEVPVAPDGLVHTFPASSTTVIRLPAS
jgi:alpha-N-arabinofuranosidase